MVPVGLAELPERAADRIDAGGRHVDRAEAAAGREVRRAELMRPEAGARLALIAAVADGGRLWLARAHLCYPGWRALPGPATIAHAVLPPASAAGPPQSLAPTGGRGGGTE